MAGSSNAAGPGVPLQASAPAGFDEIDLVDLIGFVFSMRWVLVAGVILGVSLGLIGYALTSGVFETTAPIAIDRESMPAVTDTEAIVKIFNGAMSRPAIAGRAMKVLEEQIPTLRSVAERAGVSPEGVAVGHTLGSGKGKAPPAFMELVSIGTGLGVTLRMPVQGFSDTLLPGLVAAVNEVVNLHNSSLMHEKKKVAEGRYDEMVTARRELDGLQKQQLEALHRELAQILGQVAAVEYQLRRSLGVPLLSSRQVFEREEVDLGAGSTSPSLAQGLSGYIREALRVNAAARAEKKISDAEAQANERILASLSLRAQEIASEGQPLLQAAQQVEASLAQAAQARLVPLDRMTVWLPRLTISQEVMAQLKVRGMERPTRSQLLFLVGGAFLGAFISLFVGGAVVFLRKNWHRLMQRS